MQLLRTFFFFFFFVILIFFNCHIVGIPTAKELGINHTKAIDGQEAEEERRWNA
jgi:hypothetical protein